MQRPSRPLSIAVVGLLAIVCACKSTERHRSTSHSAAQINQTPPLTEEQARGYSAAINSAALLPGDGHAVTDAAAFRYENLHATQFIPSVVIPRAGPVAVLPYRLRDDIKNAVLDTRLGRMTLDQFVQSFPLDGALIIHRGNIVYESYPNMRADDTHMLYSVSKVIVALLVARFEERGQIDTRLPIETYIPRLARSEWRGVTIRNILDMASGMAETGLEQERWETDFWASLQSPAAQSTYEFIAAMHADPHIPQGADFQYSTRNTFVLAWLIEQVSGRPLAQVVAEEIWNKIGAEQNAYMGISAAGAPHARFAMTLRDLGRFALLYTPSWSTVANEQIVSAATLHKLQHEGRPQILRGLEAELNTLSFAGEAVDHNGWQWDAVFADGSFFKSGFAGQGLLISPAHDLIIAFYGSWPAPDRKQYNRLQWLGRQLINRGYFAE